MGSTDMLVQYATAHNYFKLRDLACALIGSHKQFSTGRGQREQHYYAYQRFTIYPCRGEMNAKGSENKTAVYSTSKIVLNGNQVKLSVFTIDGKQIVLEENKGISMNLSYQMYQSRVLTVMRLPLKLMQAITLMWFKMRFTTSLIHVGIGTMEPSDNTWLL